MKSILHLRKGYFSNSLCSRPSGPSLVGKDILPLPPKQSALGVSGLWQVNALRLFRRRSLEALINLSPMPYLCLSLSWTRCLLATWAMKGYGFRYPTQNIVWDLGHREEPGKSHQAPINHFEQTPGEAYRALFGGAINMHFLSPAWIALPTLLAEKPQKQPLRKSWGQARKMLKPL